MWDGIERRGPARLLMDKLTGEAAALRRSVQERVGELLEPAPARRTRRS
jgi:hypothetical protein